MKLWNNDSTQAGIRDMRELGKLQNKYLRWVYEKYAGIYRPILIILIHSKTTLTLS